MRRPWPRCSPVCKRRHISSMPSLSSLMPSMRVRSLSHRCLASSGLSDRTPIPQDPTARHKPQLCRDLSDLGRHIPTHINGASICLGRHCNSSPKTHAIDPLPTLAGYRPRRRHRAPPVVYSGYILCLTRGGGRPIIHRRAERDMWLPRELPPRSTGVYIRALYRPRSCCVLPPNRFL